MRYGLFLFTIVAVSCTEFSGKSNVWLTNQNFNTLTNVAVAVQVDEDIRIGSKGLSIELNCFFQQFRIYTQLPDPPFKQLGGQAEIFDENRNLLAIRDLDPFFDLPNKTQNTVHAGTIFNIAIVNNNNSIATSVQFRIGNGTSGDWHAINLTEHSAVLQPIRAIMVTIGSGVEGESTEFESGNGFITYTANTPLVSHAQCPYLNNFTSTENSNMLYNGTIDSQENGTFYSQNFEATNRSTIARRYRGDTNAEG
jgi:hypothetical protein